MCPVRLNHHLVELNSKTDGKPLPTVPPNVVPSTILPSFAARVRKLDESGEEVEDADPECGEDDACEENRIHKAKGK